MPTLECTCHREPLESHEACCGHSIDHNGYGRDPDCPFHGDGGKMWPSATYLNTVRGEVADSMRMGM